MKSHSTSPGLEWKQVPRSLRVFVTRGIFLLLAWKCLYLFLLKPLHQPDALLTLGTAQATTWLFKLLSPQMQPLLFTNRDMLITALVQGRRINIISIADACNALELMVLHIGFIASATMPSGKKFPYILAGLLLILFTNITRCLALMYVYIAFPNFFPFAHHYIFTLTIYLIIFLVWKRFIKQWISYEAK